MSLIALQRAFRATLAAEDAEDDDLSPGMAIYRNAYRGRLMDALAVSFERTRRWAGEESFDAAARHYILTHPPRRWSLDDYGEAFPNLVAELFAENPEAGELAWLEWSMQRAFAAPDRAALDPAALGSVGPDQWPGVSFRMAPGFAARPVATDCTALWDETTAEPPATAATPRGLIVWRQGLSPRFRVLDPDEFAALTALAEGACFGALEPPGLESDPEAAAQKLGAWLGAWVLEGVFSGITLPAADTGDQL
jgi:Putative DNA-binding domain